MWMAPEELDEMQNSMHELSNNLNSYVMSQEAANEQRDTLLQMLIEDRLRR